MVAPIVQEAMTPGALDQLGDRKRFVHVNVICNRLEEVDRDHPCAAFELVEECMWVINVLDHVEAVHTVVPTWDVALDVVDLRVDLAALQPPAQVLDGGIGEVSEVDVVAGFDEAKAVRADAAAVVEKA